MQPEQCQKAASCVKYDEEVLALGWNTQSGSMSTMNIPCSGGTKSATK